MIFLHQFFIYLFFITKVAFDVFDVAPSPLIWEHLITALWEKCTYTEGQQGPCSNSKSLVTFKERFYVEIIIVLFIGVNLPKQANQEALREDWGLTLITQNSISGGKT